MSICLFQGSIWMHTHRNTHTSGRGRAASERGPRSRVWGSDGVPVLHHMHSCPHQGLLLHTFLQLCHPLGQRCQCGGWGVHTYKEEPIWTQLSEFCSSILGLAWPSSVGTATEHRRASGSSLPLRGDSCQHALGRGGFALLSCSSAPKPLGTQIAQG